MNGYELSKKWFDFAFDSEEKITPVHAALYFWCVELCNRLGWKKSFGLPTDTAMEAIKIRSYKTYKKALDDLEGWGFITIKERSKNQHSSTVIALVKNTKATTKALSKALTKADTKAIPKQTPSKVSIDKPNNLKPINKETKKKAPIFPIDELIEELRQLCGGMIDGSIDANAADCLACLEKLKEDFPNADPVEGIRLLMQHGKADKFHGKNLTNFSYLFRHMTKIKESAKEKAYGTTDPEMQQLINETKAGLQGQPIDGS